ncbi:CARNS1, partial [Symbiodinium pilosum]
DGFSDVPLTSVFGGYILSGSPFVEEAGAACNTLLRQAVEKFGDRWVFTLNIYPYFDTSNALDKGTTDKCTKATKSSVCFDDDCNLPKMATTMRQRMQLLTGTTTSLLWIGETGWSSPQAETLAGSNKQMAA